ncbi:ABC transporter substrate-binding protein [Amycolatopsis sp. GM8]|uniref:ABC transporter substrate-binding protein n=1 Tax=Amycolatopsis sp. GM8 TaxID=2896530 RepID=UPI001F19543B|nr:ABC transporter substrate-binding protein [Amycolatopsis sp. GM8]
MSLLPYRIAATGHSLNYLPEYLARDRGFFAEEGLDVSAVVPKPWDLVLDELAAGTSQAALGGIWVPSMYLGRATRYTPFAQVAARAPLALLGREPVAEFSWDRLPGSIMLMKGSNGASVGVFMKMLLAERGVDVSAVRFVQDLDGLMLGSLFAGGMGDYLVVDYGSAAALAARTGLRVVSPFVRDGGDVPWSVYYSEGESTPERVEIQTRFVRALNRGMQWVVEHDAAEYAGFLGETFPAIGTELAVSLTNEFRALGMWTTPLIDRAAYDRWQRGIATAALTTAPIHYDDLIDCAPTAFLASEQPASAGR